MMGGYLNSRRDRMTKKCEWMVEFWVVKGMVPSWDQIAREEENVSECKVGM